MSYNQVFNQVNQGIRSARVFAFTYFFLNPTQFRLRISQVDLSSWVEFLNYDW